ncbi:MAG: hypothetical protein K9H49_00385 [Bacteroidales bacterium]|nr:hypothetical protein [Bacteroidales bacterium]MCF8389311.1 hypothetical protein [Bacteroidales bacterium]
MEGPVFALAIIFLAIYQVIKVISEHLLKRRLIRDNLIDKAEVLSHFNSKNDEGNSYPTLKWGLVAMFAGIAFILIEILQQTTTLNLSMENSYLPIGIILVFVSLAFLLYFFIAKKRENK